MKHDDMGAIFDQALDRFRAAWEEAGYVVAIGSAIEFCGMFQRPLPDWLRVATLALVFDKQTDAERERLLDSAKDHLRYLTVQMIRDRGGAKSWTQTWDKASEALKDTPAKGGPDAIKRSYGMVRDHARAGRLGKYIYCGGLHDPASRTTWKLR